MENNPNFQSEDTAQSVYSAEILENMPSFKEHIQQAESDLDKTKLREEFLGDHYGAYNDLDDCFSYYAISEFNPDNLPNHLRPQAIAERYGDQIEKYGASLADVNILLGALNDQKYKDGYLNFCTQLPWIIDRHFSDKTSDEDKKMMGGIIRKYSEYSQSLDYGNSKAKKQPILSEEESDFIVKELVNSLAKEGKKVEDVCFKTKYDQEVLPDAYMETSFDVLLNSILVLAEDNQRDYWDKIFPRVKDKITDPSKIHEEDV